MIPLANRQTTQKYNQIVNNQRASTYNINQPTHQSSQSSYRPNHQPTYQPNYQPINQFNNQPYNQPVYYQFNPTINQVYKQSSPQLIKRPIQQQIPEKISEKKIDPLQFFNSLASLPLETKKEIDSKNSQVKSDDLIKGIFQKYYEFPETHQSLIKVQELDSCQQKNPQELTHFQTQFNQNSQIPKISLVELDSMKQSQFKNENYKKAPKVAKYSNIKKGQQKFDITNLLLNMYNQNSQSYEKLNKLDNLDESAQKTVDQNRPINNRNVKTIHKFKIQDLPGQNEAEFKGCCGFGISKNMTFHKDTQ